MKLTDMIETIGDKTILRVAIGTKKNKQIFIDIDYELIKLGQDDFDEVIGSEIEYYIRKFLEI